MKIRIPPLSINVAQKGRCLTLDPFCGHFGVIEPHAWRASAKSGRKSFFATSSSRGMLNALSIGSFPAKKSRSSTAVSARNGNTSSRLRLEYPARTETLGLSSSNEKLALVRLANSLDRYPVSTASLYNIARSTPVIPHRTGPLRVASNNQRTSSTA